MLDYHYGDHLPVHDHGYVSLLEIMGSDKAIVDAARISYDNKGKSADRALIRYLLRHGHTTPFEMAVLKFELKMPIFVARQWIRHRTASINEMSARYTELPDEMFVPEVLAIQDPNNKQGRSDDLPEQDLSSVILGSNDSSYRDYKFLLDAGVTRELARGVLPLNIYTKFIWKMDLHNLMHFLKLRLDPHAQKEIRDFAEVIEKLVNLKFPVAYEAFVDYVRDAYTCSRMEVRLLGELIEHFEDDDESLDRLCRITGMSEREMKEFKERFF